ncbi:hypothetical protein D3C81_2084020 [compost metagenome]
MGLYEPGENFCRIAKLCGSLQQSGLLQSAESDRALLCGQCAADHSPGTRTCAADEPQAERLRTLSGAAVLAMGHANRRCIHCLVVDL